MSRRSYRLVAATVLVAAAWPTALGAAPASAATCATGGGVSVVVDFRELGSGVQSACDTAGAGRTATALFTGNGFPLTYAQRQPGFVCRVSGVPTTDPCVNTSPASAYWGLYWSDGKSGSWAYSTLGAGSLRIPEGGSVAFAWQAASAGGPAEPPPAYAASPSPEPTPTATPTPKPTPTSGGPSPTRPPSPSATPAASPPSRSPSPTASPSVARPASVSPTPKPTKSADPGSTATPTGGASVTPPVSEPDPPTSAAGLSSDPSDPSDPTGPSGAAGSVPLPLVVGALGLLGALVVGAGVVRRRRAG